MHVDRIPIYYSKQAGLVGYASSWLMAGWTSKVAERLRLGESGGILGGGREIVRRVGRSCPDLTTWTLAGINGPAVIQRFSSLISFPQLPSRLLSTKTVFL